MPPQAKDAAFRVIETLRPLVDGARWVPRDNLHVTLKFLGRLADERVPAVADACARAASGMVDFDARLAGTGAFPSARRARVLWIGLHDNAGGFAAVAGALEDAFAPLGFEREKRPFAAHLTIARLKVPAPVSLPEVDIDEHVRVDRLTLFQSHLQRPAPRYEPLATFPFRTP